MEVVNALEKENLSVRRLAERGYRDGGIGEKEGLYLYDFYLYLYEISGALRRNPDPEGMRGN
nr:unnamed protein product [Callosobruchus analis]